MTQQRTIISGSVLSNRQLEIAMAPGTPIDVGGRVVAMLRQCAKLIPPWVQFITVRFDAASNNHDARVTHQAEYRRCTIAVTGHWLGYDDRYRRQIICHEIAHLWTAGMHDAFYQSIAAALPEHDAARKLAEGLFDDAEERTVESIGWLMESLLAIREAHL